MSLSYLVLAKIEMLTAAHGGRSGPLRVTYRPNHNFGNADNREMGMGYINLPEGRAVYPGETFETMMTLFPPPGVEVFAGLRWRIQEGPKLVAWATVLTATPINENSN